MIHVPTAYRYAVACLSASEWLCRDPFGSFVAMFDETRITDLRFLRWHDPRRAAPDVLPLRALVSTAGMAALLSDAPTDDEAAADALLRGVIASRFPDTTRRMPDSVAIPFRAMLGDFPPPLQARIDAWLMAARTNRVSDVAEDLQDYVLLTVDAAGKLQEPDTLAALRPAITMPAS